MNPLLSIIDLVITGNNGSILTVMIGNNGSVIICNKNVIIFVKKLVKICNNQRNKDIICIHFYSTNKQ